MFVHICPSKQELTLFKRDQELARYPISTAKNGLGCEKNSYKTPIGMHYIRAKIGGGAPMNSVFRARRPTGEILDKQLFQDNPKRDWILSRIIWLSGLTKGVNRLANVDTMQRYIYLHGTPDWLMTGKPESHGCIRMLNTDIIELFDIVKYRDVVYIGELNESILEQSYRKY